jgi:hypothetical protein
MYSRKLTPDERFSLGMNPLTDGTDEGRNMDRPPRSLIAVSRYLSAAMLLLFVPALARAEALRFHNETTGPVIIQCSSVVGGTRLMRDRPYLLNVGDKTPDIVLPGNKTITISEAKVPNRVLFQGVIPAGTDDQAFNILLDGQRVKVEKRKPKRGERP